MLNKSLSNSILCQLVYNVKPQPLGYPVTSAVYKLTQNKKIALEFCWSMFKVV